MKDKLQNGQLVRVKVGALTYTPDGFANSAIYSDGKVMLYEEIDLFSFPSFDDFYGRKIVVEDGDVATINKYIGRPSQISKDPKWFSYDVYEILIHGTFVKIFRENLQTL
jgi:hypothetical protein